MIIALSGVDGSGKSTQIELLEQALSEAGHKTEVIWFRAGYSEIMTWLRAMVRHTKPDLLPRATGDEARARKKVFARPSVRAAWMAMAVSDVLLNLAGRIRADEARGRVVICDRYLFDSMLDLELRFDEFAKVRPWVEWLLRRLVPRPDVSILLVVPREVMHDRLEKKDEPFPDPPELRDTRYDRYQAWARSGEVVVVDGAKSIAEVHERVVGIVGHAMGKPLRPVLEVN